MEEPEIALQLRMLTALGFFPPQHVVREFAAVCNEVRRNLGDDAEELLVNFEDTGIGRFPFHASRDDPMHWCKASTNQE